MLCFDEGDPCNLVVSCFNSVIFRFTRLSDCNLECNVACTFELNPKRRSLEIDVVLETSC